MISLTRSEFCSRSSWLSAQTVSPLSACLVAHGWPNGLACSTRSFVHLTANPVFKMPPGYSVDRKLSSSTDSGVIEFKLGG